MSYNHQSYQSYGQSGQGSEGWDSGGMTAYTTAPLQYTVSAPATTTSSQQFYGSYTHQPRTTAGYTTGLNATTHNDYAVSYSGQPRLPVPTTGNYEPGPINVASYSSYQQYGQQGSQYGTSYATSDTLSPTWPHSTAPGYESHYTFEQSTQASDSGDSTREPSPRRESSDQGTTTGAKKEKKFVCYRVSAETGATCSKRFARKADLQRHERCVHDKDKQPRIDCRVRNCSRKGDNGFLRSDHLTEHLRQFHKRNIVKRERRPSNMGIDDEDDDDDVATVQSQSGYSYTGYQN